MDITPLISQLTIATKGLGTCKLTPNPVQLQYVQAINEQLSGSGRVRIIVLKARQMGISTITEALLFNLAFIYERYRGLIVAHEIPASQNLLKMTQLYWDTYPYKFLYTPKYNSKNDLEWAETGSSIKVATAGNKGLGRSATIHFLHASEVAFWPDASDVFLGVRQTIPNVPGTGIVIESTAKGIGNFFHSTWVAATEGEVEYLPLFFPWHQYPEYQASAIGLPYHNLGHLDAEEITLRGMGISDDRLAWRRWAIKNLAENDILKFRQEYPASPEEAFISTGTNVFPYHQLKACYKPEEGYPGYLTRNGNSSTFVPDPDGPLRVFKAPATNEWGQYFVSGDPTRTTRGDFAVAQVINRRTLEQVAEWRGRIDPGTFAEELFKLGIYYNEAELSTEKEGPGYATIGKLLGMEYPKVWQHAKADKTPGIVTTDLYGWSTTAQTKQLMIGYLLKVVMDHNLVIHSRTLFTEMQNYVTYENGGYGPASEEGFDDCVMSMAQGITCHLMSSPVMPYGSAMIPEYPNSEAAVEGGMMGIELPWERWRGPDEEAQ